MARVSLSLFLVMLSTCAAWAQDWQTRAICDLRRGGGPGRACACIVLGSEVIMLLPEKAGRENVAVLAEFSDNLDKAQVSWDAPCRDQAHCPDYAYTVRYAFVSRKVAVVHRDKTFTAQICKDSAAQDAAEECACRAQLLATVREMVLRAKRQGALLAILSCIGLEVDAGGGESRTVGFELTYAFVDVPDMVPLAGDDPKKAARQAAAELYSTVPGAAGPAQPQPASAAPAAAAVKAPASSAALGVVMQVAALPNVVQAETLADRLSAKGIEAFFERAEVNGREIYRVMAVGGPDPQEFARRLAAMGFPGAIPRRPPTPVQP